MRFRGEVIYCHATPVRDARLPSDSEHKQPRFAVLGLHSSLQSIRAAHDGSTLLTPRFHPAYGYNPSLVTSVTGGPVPVMSRNAREWYSRQPMRRTLSAGCVPLCAPLFGFFSVKAI